MAYTINNEKLKGLDFGKFGELYCFLYSPITQIIHTQYPYIFCNSNKFAKFYSAQQIYWQIHQTLVPPICRLWYTLNPPMVDFDITQGIQLAMV